MEPSMRNTGHQGAIHNKKEPGQVTRERSLTLATWIADLEQ